MGRIYTGNLPDVERFDRLRKRTGKTCVLSNYLSQHALVLRGADTISNARTANSAPLLTTDLRERMG